MTEAQKARLRGSTARGASRGSTIRTGSSLRGTSPLALLALLARLQGQAGRASPAGFPARADLIADVRSRLQSGIDATIGAGADAILGEAQSWATGALATALTSQTIPEAPAILSALAAAAPAGAVATLIGGTALGIFDAFGGDFSIPTYATTPQLDATTALGMAAARAQAPLIRQSILDTGTKYAFKGGTFGSL